MKLVVRIFEVRVGIIAGLVLVLIYIAARVIAWAASVACGLMLLLAFFNWIGWKAAHHIASWHSFVWALEYADLCALIVFVVHGLPMFFIKPDPPLRLDQAFDPSRL